MGWLRPAGETQHRMHANLDPHISEPPTAPSPDRLAAASPAPAASQPPQLYEYRSPVPSGTSRRVGLDDRLGEASSLSFPKCQSASKLSRRRSAISTNSPFCIQLTSQEGDPRQAQMAHTSPPCPWWHPTLNSVLQGTWPPAVQTGINLVWVGPDSDLPAPATRIAIEPSTADEGIDPRTESRIWRDGACPQRGGD